MSTKLSHSKSTEIHHILNIYTTGKWGEEEKKNK